MCLGQPGVGTVSTASTVACKVYQAVANLLRSEQSGAPRREDRKVKTPLPREFGSAGSPELQSVCVARRILTYGPQDSIKGACVLLARGMVLPGDLQLASWEFFDDGGNAAFQESGTMRFHVLCDQR